MPILAIAPMVVVWLGGEGLPGWVPVAVIAAYLTFFPVTINTLRGLDSADPRALELMRSYAASEWSMLWKLKVPASLPYLFAALQDRGDGQRRRRDHRRAAVVDPGRARRRDPQLQPVLPQLTRRASGRRTSSRPLLGISFFLVVAIAEKLVVRRAPENVA